MPNMQLITISNGCRLLKMVGRHLVALPEEASQPAAPGVTDSQRHPRYYPSLPPRGPGAGQHHPLL